MALSNTDLFLVQDATTKANYQISFENLGADLSTTYVEVAGDNMTGDLTLGPVGDSKITFSSSTGNGSFGGDLDITGKGSSASTVSGDPGNTLVTKDYADYEIENGGRWEEDSNKLYPKNLNANVGIGTDSPGKSLHVKDSASNLVRVESTSTAARVEFVASGTSSTDQVSVGSLGDDLQLNAGGATRATVKSNGRVGIGTSSPQAILHIGGTSTTGLPTLFFSRSPSVSNTTDIALSANAVIRSENSIRNVINDGGIFSWYVGGTDNKAGTAGSSEKMRLDANGNLGIGTESPAQALEIKKVSPIIQLTDSGNNSTARFAISRYAFNDGNGAEIAVRRPGDGVATDSVMQFRVGGSGTANEKMRIDGITGNVGINTSSPAEKLEVDGNIGIGRVNGGYRFLEVTGGGLRGGMVSNASNDVQILTGGGTLCTHFGNGGGVGINTDAPAGKLEVVGSNDATSAVASQFTSNIKTNTAYLHLGGVNGYPALQGSGTGTAFHMLLNPLEGRVGIGIDSTPEAELHVGGTIKADDFDIDGITKTSYLRSDVDDTFSGDNLTINGRLSIRGNMDLSDGENLDFGSSDDVRINYNANNWLYCNFRTGNGIYFQDNGTTKIVLEDSGVFRPHTTNTGTVGGSSYYWNNGYFQTFNVSSTLNVRGAIDLADNDILRFGSGDDAEMFFDASNLYLDLNLGDFTIRDGTINRFTFEDNGVFTANNRVAAGFPGTGQAALTVNDGGGNCNLTFNHSANTADQDGNAFRITGNTDSSSSAALLFEVYEGVTGNTSVSTPDIIMRLTPSGLSVPGTVTADDFDLESLPALP